MKIIVETAYGPIESVDLDEQEMQELQLSFEQRFDRMTHLTVETVSGPVWVPKEMLSRSVVRFVSEG